MVLLGYARVSSTDQSNDIQRETLEKAGCVRIFEERISGAKADNREELQALLSFAKPGDIIMVCKLDRMARSTLDLLTIVTDLGKRGIKFQSLAEPWANTDNPAAELMLTLMAGIAQFERGRLRERQLEGIAKAKDAGKYRGSKRKVSPEIIRELKEQGLGAAAIARRLGCARMSVYRALNGG